MALADRLAALLPRDAAALMEAHGARVTELRLRAGRPAQVVWPGGEAMSGESIDAEALRRLLAALMDYSVYARQDELDRGFFTLADGSRVGVCGRMFAGAGGPRMGEIGSVCIRVARALPGCADGIMGWIMGGGLPESALLASPPGLGKTTLLRDAARQLSEAGFNVGLADERHELAACHMGAPTLDVGPRTDVADGCPRDEAVRRLLRSMAPDVIVADEVGGPGDAEALADAARCGVAVLASAHGGSFDALEARPCLRSMLDGATFGRVMLLGPRPGAVREVWRREWKEGMPVWTRE